MIRQDRTPGPRAGHRLSNRGCHAASYYVYIIYIIYIVYHVYCIYIYILHTLHITCTIYYIFCIYYIYYNGMIKKVMNENKLTNLQAKSMIFYYHRVSKINLQKFAEQIPWEVNPNNLLVQHGFGRMTAGVTQLQKLCRMHSITNFAIFHNF